MKTRVPKEIPRDSQSVTSHPSACLKRALVHVCLMQHFSIKMQTLENVTATYPYFTITLNISDPDVTYISQLDPPPSAPPPNLQQLTSVGGPRGPSGHPRLVRNFFPFPCFHSGPPKTIPKNANKSTATDFRWRTQGSVRHPASCSLLFFFQSMLSFKPALQIHKYINTQKNRGPSGHPACCAYFLFLPKFPCFHS